MPTALSTSVEVSAGVEAVYAVLTGPAWPAALDARLGDGSTLLSVEPTADGGLRLVQARRLPDAVPSFLRRFAPEDGRVTQTDVWGPAVDGTRTGTWEVALPGSPARVHGVTRVEPAGGGARWVVTGEVAVSVPLVGRRAESLLAPLITTLVGRQGEVLRTLV